VLAQIQAQTGTLPLVLHGGSGIPDAMVKKAITLGVAKVNVNTECQIAFTEATRKFIEEGRDRVGNGFTRARCWPRLEASKAGALKR
jgi:fructose-bisphosphate aldolase class II